LLTVLEARKGQGFPDDEVLVGMPAEQWKIVGNSVARPVALALGICLRTAWLASNARSAVDAATEKLSNDRVTIATDGQRSLHGKRIHGQPNPLEVHLQAPKTLQKLKEMFIGPPDDEEDELASPLLVRDGTTPLRTDHGYLFEGSSQSASLSDGNAISQTVNSKLTFRQIGNSLLPR